MSATDVVVVIGGQNVTPFCRVGRVRIDDLLNDAPNTASLTLVATPRHVAAGAGAFDPGAFDAGGFWSSAPGAAFDAVGFNPLAFMTTAPPYVTIAPPPILPGATIAIYQGAIDPSAILFGGQITVREQYAELDVPAHVRYDLSCLDWSRRLNYRTVTTEYFTGSVTTIVADLVRRFAPVITTGHVQAGLPSIPGMTLTFESVSGALSRLATMIGAYWYVDYLGDLHFFTGTESGPSPAPIVPGGRFADLKIAADLTQVRTRVILEGAGGTAAATLGAADALIPLSTAVPFNTAGGRAKIGTTLVTYTGKNPGGVKANTVGTAPDTSTPPVPAPDPPGAPTAALAPTSTAGQLSGGPYRYAVTLEMNDDRRSAVGPTSNSVTIAAAPDPPATSAALGASPSPGPIAVGVASTYATSFVDAAGRETVATPGGTSLTGRAVIAPTNAVTITITLGGRVKTGSYFWGVSYLTPHGETLATLTVPIVVGFDNASVILGLPTSPDTRVTGRRIYRSTGDPAMATTNPPVVPWQRVIDVPDNTATTFTDSAADSELADATLPAFATATDAGEAATVTLPRSADPRIVGRRLYRKDGAGEYRLIAEIRDNVTTTFQDVVVATGGNLAPHVSAITTGAILLSSIPTGPTGTVRRRIFRTTAGGVHWRELVAINDNTTAALTDTTPDSGLGGSPLPAQGIPGDKSTGVAPPTPAGATTIQVDTLANIPASGWILAEEQVIRYTGTSTSGGLFLTGIPASGPGAITADILAGTVVSTVPAITGVAPPRRVTIGDDVNLIVYVDDTAAQAALAAVEGGDGILEHYIQDRRLSEDGAQARGLAELALFKTIETRVSYTTHDPDTRSGRTVHIDLPAPTNLTGDFLIQRVTIDSIATWTDTAPKRSVDASTTRFSFEDVLARLLLEQT